MKELNIMVVGVGGQGTLLTSRIIGKTALKAGFDVKLSEVHGMAQRGGSVVTFVRFGQKVNEPVVEEGSADIIIAFERLEALRYAHFLKKDGALIVNDWRIDPMPVVIGAAQYPSDALDKISEKGAFVDALDALSLAEEAGSSKAVNVVLMGRLAKYLDIPVQHGSSSVLKRMGRKTDRESLEKLILKLRKFKEESSNTLKPLFKSKNDYKKFLLRHDENKVKRRDISTYKGDVFVGIEQDIAG